METDTITIVVESQAARAYNTSSAEQRRKIDVLLSFRLDEVVRETRSLEDLMGELSRRAQECGLRPAQGTRLHDT